jgi:RNA polymerase sigma-70 factor (ECF subfamily)
MRQVPIVIQNLTFSIKQCLIQVNDQILVEKIKDGNRKAFEELVLKYQKEIYFLAYRMVLNKEDAADVVQEIFVQVFRKIHQFHSFSTFKTWLYRVAINQCKNFLRTLKKNRESAPVEDYVVTDPNDSQLDLLLKNEKVDLISETIEKLPKKQKAVLILRTYQELSYKEIAEIVGGSVNSAKVNFYHAIENIKRLVG